jgi:nucleotide sugar dehydrogenase
VSASVAGSDAVIVLVPALLTSERQIDWSNLLNASDAIAKGLRQGMLVSYETTVPVGGCRDVLVPALERSGLRAGSDFHVVFSPERVKSRQVFARLRDTPKVVGGIDTASAAAGEEFYARWLGAPVINVGSLEAAEFVKLAGMAYRDANIAIANELATLAEEFGLDIRPLLGAANTDGETHLLEPGIGVGGHCTPVYPYFLINGADRLGVGTELLALARTINEQQPRRHMQRLAAALGGLGDRRVHILGLAFRPQIREDAYSPAFSLQRELIESGAIVTIEDPLYSAAEIGAKGFVASRVDASRIDAVVLNTAHPEFASPDFAGWASAGVKAVVDGRALWSQDEVEAAGLIFIGIGVASAPAASCPRRR